MPRTPRRRLATNIYRDQYSLTAVVRLNGRPLERAFPIDTPLDEIQAWQRLMRLAWTARRRRGQIKPAP